MQAELAVALDDPVPQPRDILDRPFGRLAQLVGIEIGAVIPEHRITDTLRFDATRRAEAAEAAPRRARRGGAAGASRDRLPPYRTGPGMTIHEDSRHDPRAVGNGPD